MKKLPIYRIFSLMLALAIVLSLAQPLCVWAVAADIVYIDPAGGADTNAGTETAPVKTLAGAYGKLLKGGTIVFLSDLQITGNTLFPVCAYPVTLTSKTGAEGIVTTGSLRMQGDTTFKDITVTFNASGLAFISGEGNDLTIDTGVTTVNKTGNQVNLVATKRFDATLSANPTLTVKSGTWDYIYATHGNSVTGNITVKVEGGSCRAVSPSYNAVVTGNVNISIKNATVKELYLEPTHKNGKITGNLNISLDDGAGIGKSYGTTGVVQGGTTVEVVGNVESIDTLTGYGEGSNLILRCGTWKGTAEAFGAVAINVAAEEIMTLSGPITADTVNCAGTLNFDGVGSLTAKSVTGTVNCTITGRVLKNNLYISAPANADIRFPDTYGMVNTDGQYMIYDLVNFEGLVIQANKNTTITLYSNAIQGNDAYYGRAEYTVTPYATATSGDNVLYYYPNITGIYCYEAVQSGCYTIFQQLYMTDAEAAAYTLEPVVMQQRDGEWDHAYYYGLSDELLYATEGDPNEKWKTEVTLNTPVFTTPDKPAHQQTTQPELEAFIGNLDDANDNMYVYSIGTSSKYGFNVPIVFFTKTDLSACTTLEQVAEALKKDGLPNMAYKAQTHGDEPAGCEGALAVIDALDKEENEYLLDSINIYVIPRINPDGAYDSKRNLTVMLDPSYENRDPDRDLLDMNSKEMRQYMRTVDLFQPVMELDGHERQRGSSDGDIQLGIAWKPINSQALLDIQVDMLKNTCADLKAMDLSGAWYSGEVNSNSARNNRGYATYQGRIQILMETRGIYLGNEAYAHRTACHVVSAMSFLNYAAENATELAALVAAERQRIITEGAVYDEEDIIILSTGKSKHPELTLQTERYHLISGEVTIIDQIPDMHDQILRSRVAPTAYVLPADLPKIDAILDQMDAQSITYTKLPANAAVSLQQYYGTTDEAFLSEETTVVFPNGAYVFTMGQAKGEILALLMEPDVTDLALYKNNLTFQGKIPQDANGYFSSYRYVHDLVDGKIAYTLNPVTTITTVYVSASGNDSNAGTETAPVATIEKAYALLGSSLSGTDVTGTIVLLDDYTITSAARVDMPSHDFPVIIRGKAASVKLIYKPTTIGESYQQLAFHGPTTLDNLELRMESASKLDYIFACGHPFTVGENVTTSCISSMPNLVGGDYNKAVENTDLTILGGKWYALYAGSFKADTTGTAKITVNNATVNGSVRTNYSGGVTGNTVMDLKNLKVNNIYPAYSGNVTGDVTIILRENVTANVYTGNYASGNTGTVKVVAAGADLTKLNLNNAPLASNTTGKVAKGILVYTGGDATPIAGFDEVHIDTDSTVTLVADLTVDKICGGGVVELKGYHLTGAAAVDAEVKSVSLRPGAAGLYFTGNFQVGAEATFGIALSTEDENPVAEDNTASLYTVGNNSVLVKDIMKPGSADNSANANKVIYARAYVKLSDGTTLYSETVTVTLRQVVMAADAKWDALTTAQQEALRAMYELYAAQMASWRLPNLKNG